jgi:hypothetical protein
MEVRFTDREHLVRYHSRCNPVGNEHNEALVDRKRAFGGTYFINPSGNGVSG